MPERVGFTLDTARASGLRPLASTRTSRRRCPSSRTGTRWRASRPGLVGRAGPRHCRAAPVPSWPGLSLCLAGIRTFLRESADVARRRVESGEFGMRQDVLRKESTRLRFDADGHDDLDNCPVPLFWLYSQRIGVGNKGTSGCPFCLALTSRQSIPRWARRNLGCSSRSKQTRLQRREPYRNPREQGASLAGLGQKSKHALSEGPIGGSRWGKTWPRVPARSQSTSEVAVRPKAPPRAIRRLPIWATMASDWHLACCQMRMPGITTGAVSPAKRCCLAPCSKNEASRAAR